jgi:hypothetical protein
MFVDPLQIRSGKVTLQRLTKFNALVIL